MRIIGGEFSGRKLHAPRNHEVRPTSDRIRESLFSIIESRFPDRLEDARILDLFAGTGALGLEAMSRGGEYCYFLDKSPRSLELVRSNIDMLGLGDRTTVRRMDALKLPDNDDQQQFELVFADPPYNRNLADRTLDRLIDGNWLKPGAILIVEESASAILSIDPQLIPETDRKYGDTRISLYRYEPIVNKVTKS